jgi:hypothetical protein
VAGRLPAHDGARRGHAGAEADEEHEVAVGDAAGVEGVGEGEGDRGRGGVAGAVEHDGGTVDADAEPVAGRGDDAQVRLVRHDEGDVVGVHPGAFERAGRRVDHDPHGPAEHFSSLHLERAAEVAVQRLLGAAVGVEIPTEQRRRSVDGAEDRSGRAVGEEHGRVAVGPVGDASEGVGADHQDRVRPGGDESLGGDERVHPTRAGGVQVEGAAAEPETVLDRGRRGRHGPVGCGRREDQQVDLGRGDAGVGERSAPRLDRELGRGAADATLSDAGALDDPGVAGVHPLLEVVVGDDPLGQSGAPADDRTAAGHEPSLRSQAIGWRLVTRSVSSAM